MSKRRRSSVLGDIGNAAKRILGVSPAEEEQKPEEISPKNRDNANEIESILTGIIFRDSKLAILDPEEAADQQALRDAMLQKLKATETTFDDVTAIDEVLKYAAKAWSEAVREGYLQKAQWAASAVTNGINTFRQAVSGDHQEDSADVLQAKLEQIQHYAQIIKYAESIDIARLNLSNHSADMRKKLELFRPIQQEVQAAKKDPDKMLMLAAIKNVSLNLMPVENLTEEESELRDKINEGVSMAQGIQRLREEIEKEKVKLNTLEMQLTNFRTKLKVIDVNDLKTLSAKHKVLLDQIVRETQETLTIADRVRQDVDAFEAEMRTVWSSSAANNLARKTSEFIDDQLMQTDKNQTSNAATAVQMVRNLQENAEQSNAQSEELHALYRQLEQENENLNQNQNENQNSNLNINFNT